jgi:peroxidase
MGSRSAVRSCLNATFCTWPGWAGLLLAAGIIAFIVFGAVLATQREAAAVTTFGKITHALEQALALPPQRPFDGRRTGQPGDRGAVGSALLRLVPLEAAAAGKRRLAAQSLPDIGELDAVLFAAVPPDGRTEEPRLTAWAWLWGQWVMHELLDTITPLSSTNGGADGLDFVDDRQTPIVNAQSSFIDGSNVYGNSAALATSLRGGLQTHGTGRLAMNGSVLPGWPAFVAGDVRANQHAWLQALHTLWAREHNYWALRLHTAHPQWTGDEIFAAARWAVVGEQQSITYQEWLPTLLGREGYARFVGPPTSVPPTLRSIAANDPRCSVEAAAALLRFGHSMIGANVSARYALEQGVTMPHGADASLARAELDQLLVALHEGTADRADLYVTPALRASHSLMGRDVQRARAWGVASYEQLAAHLGLPAEYDTLLVDQAALEVLYGQSGTGSDALVGALAEPHESTCAVGAVIGSVLGDLMRRVRDGDAYFYAWDAGNPPYAQELRAEVHTTRLAHVLRRNLVDQALAETVPASVFSRNQ